MAGGYDVSVTLKLNDHASKNLKTIENNIRNVIKAAEEYDRLLDRIYGRAFYYGKQNYSGTSGIGSTNHDRRTNKIISDEEANTINSVMTSMKGLKSATDAMVISQKSMNAEFDKLPNTVFIDTTQAQESLKNVGNSLHDVLKAQEEFVTTAREKGIEVMPSGTETALRATENAIENVTTAYKNMKAAQENGEQSNTQSVKQAYSELETAMKNVKTLQNQINMAMKNASTEDILALKDAYDRLDKEMSDLINDQQKLANVTNQTVTSPAWIKPTTEEIRKLDTAIDSLIDSEDKLQTETKQSTQAMDKFNNELDDTTTSAKSSSSALDGITSKIKGLIGMYAGVETLKTAFDWSDQLTLTEGKLSQLTDDVEGLMDDIYQMSQDTRTSYMDNASQIAKMWQLTGGTDGIFESEEKLIQFNELLNKGFILGGSGTREINASMYQLTQALSSGRLQGDELRSLAENAPYLINTITDSIEEMYNAGKSQEEWIDLTYNDLKKLGAEGVLTAEVITNAVLNSADEIRDAYENITPTWEQTFQVLKNQVQKVSQPVLKTLNEMINSESFEKFTQTLVKIFAVVMAFIQPILQGIMWIGAFMADNWSIIEPIIWGLIGAFAAYLGYLALAKVYTIALGVAQGFQLLMSGGVGLSMVNNNTALAIYNGLAPIAAVMSNMLGAAKMFLAGATWSAVVAEYGLLAPLLLIIAVIGAVIGILYLAVAAYNHFTGSTVSATGIIVGAFYWLWEGIKNVFKWIWNLLVEVAEFIANVFNDPVYYAKKLFAGFGKAVLNIFKWIASGIESLVNFFIDGINAMIGAYNKIPFADDVAEVGKVDFTSGFDDAIAKIDKWVGKKETKDIDYSDKKFEYGDMGEAWDKGYAKGEKFAEDVKKLFSTDKYLDEDDDDKDKDEYDYESYIPGIDEYLDSLPDYDTPNVGTSSSLPDDVTNAIKGIKGDTDELTDMSREELKYLRDIAEQKVINRFTTAEIKVTNNMNNNISGDRDIDGMADYFAKVIEKACETTAERYNGA